MEKYKATPAARKVARDYHISLSEITGSGEFGRIYKRDVQSYEKNILLEKTNFIKTHGYATPLAKRMAKDLKYDIQAIKGTGYKHKVLAQDIIHYETSLNNKVNDKLDNLQNIEKLNDVKHLKGHKEKSVMNHQMTQHKFNEVDGEWMPLTPMRKTVSSRMVDSYFQVPAYTLDIEVDMRKINAIRESIKPEIIKSVGEKVTVTDLIMLATAKTLRKHPIINSAWTDKGIFIYKDINIALAVGLDEGLYVPVVRTVDNKSIGQIVKETKTLARKAMDNKIKPSDQEGNTFTISSVGMFGIKSFNPIINMPSSGILGIGTTIDRLVLEEGEIVTVPTLTLCLTLDHRVVDGTPGAKFLRDLKMMIENPMTMFI